MKVGDKFSLGRYELKVTDIKMGQNENFIWQNYRHCCPMNMVGTAGQSAVERCAGRDKPCRQGGGVVTFRRSG
ncbi:MAG: hypothetical protein B7Z50_04410 [Sphingomonadales bacterium 12-62-5]|nr:MAG: hypothetical protein B7Z50_04410 [Sphingomonadales bacterium 12-62-5]